MVKYIKDIQLDNNDNEAGTYIHYQIANLTPFLSSFNTEATVYLVY